MFDKTGKGFIFNICYFYTTSVNHDSFYSDYRFSKWQSSAIFRFIFSQFLPKIHISAYFYVDVQNFVKIERAAAEIMHIVDFQNSGLPPYLIYNISLFDKNSNKWLFYVDFKV